MTKTINDVYIALLARLKDANEPQPVLYARELTAFACHADKHQIVDWAHVYLDDATVDYANLLCDRCIDGEPLAYLIGEWDFCGLTFAVDPSVLIPRPETERLVELAVARAQQKVSPRVLDLCCGSGCIGISVAHMVEDAKVACCDIADGALRLTRENALRHGVQNRVAVFKGDALHRPQNNLGAFEIIVSNPPYVTRAEMAQLDRSVADFEPHEALFGGEDGLDFYRAICPYWGELLAPGGLMLVECGDKQAMEIASIFEENDYGNIGITEDYAGRQRVVYGYNLKPSAL